MKKLYEMGLVRIEVKKGTDATRRNMASICVTYGDMLENSKRDQQAALEMYEESLKWMKDIFDKPNPGTEPGAYRPRPPSSMRSNRPNVPMNFMRMFSD